MSELVVRESLGERRFAATEFPIAVGGAGSAIVMAGRPPGPEAYLGYWVEGSDRMAYKASFRPLERLGRDGWRRMDAIEPEVPVFDRPLPTRAPRRILVDA